MAVRSSEARIDPDTRVKLVADIKKGASQAQFLSANLDRFALDRSLRKPEEFEYFLVKNCQTEQTKITASNAQRYWAWPMLAPFGLTARHAR